MFRGIINHFTVGMLSAVVVLTATDASASVIITKSTQQGTKEYIPTIWVDPDGCEHWVMDDGTEGFMTPHVTREGIPVCNRGKACAVLNSDQLFATNKSYVGSKGRARLQHFFKNAGAHTYLIDGHTDSDASDAYNMRLSKKRAIAIAKIAKSVGAKSQARWYGERAPIASNRTRSGKAKNRRVEITCIR